MSIETRLLETDRRARHLLYMAVGAGFLAAALFIAQAYLLSVVVNGVFLAHQSLQNVLPLFVLLLALLLIRVGLIWASEILAQHSASRVKGSLRDQLTRRLIVLGPAYTRQERSGELVNTVVEGVETLDEYITQYLPARQLAGLVPALVFLVVLVLDPWTTLVLLFTGPMLLLLLALIGGRARDITDRRFLELSWMSAHFLDMLQGLTTLKLFGRSKEQAENIEFISLHYAKTTMEVLRTAFQTSLVMEWAATAATALVALEVSLRLMNGLLPFTIALAVLLLTPEFFLPLRQMSLKYHSGTAGKGAATRIFAILDTRQPAEPAVPAERQTQPPALPARFGLCFTEVSYAYEGGKRPALRGFSLLLPHGQTVALVGATGAGKSTVANLLLRFIDPDAGSIMLNDLPIQAIERAMWLSQVAWVPQLPHLFHGTVAENIRLARPSASQDEVTAASQAAHAHTFIQRLPLGYDTPLSEQGVRLSGGQRQRIAIARAFLKNAPFLLLDEATSHLDVESENQIQAALAGLMRGRTVLIIAHSLKLASSADQIVVMEQGSALETGSHFDLMARGGLYRQLVVTYEGGTV